MTHSFYDEGMLVTVMTTQPIDRTLDYKSPEGGCHLGAFVEVPLGPRKVLGVIWGKGTGNYEYSKIRTISRVFDVVPMRLELRDFLEKAAAYTLTPMPAMLRLATRAPRLTDPPSTQRVYRRANGEPTRMTEARARVLTFLNKSGDLTFTLKELTKHSDVTSSVVTGLVKQGIIAEENCPRDLPFQSMNLDLPCKKLTAEQFDAAEKLTAAVASGNYGTTLLRGVTGSGKTEVYFEAIATAMRLGRQALVLLPEIALTGEFLTRIERRFGAQPAEWHSGATMTERRRIWRMVGQGKAQLVVGARSALFLPYQNLGLIVVDEEHDTSYKQEDGVIYNARDMAVLRASQVRAHVVLASATPSLESWANVQNGKYTRLDLNARFGMATLPEIKTIDMRNEKLPANRWISQALQNKINARLNVREQVMLFLNRRGFAPITLCRACGFQIGCDQCDARMVEHRFSKSLMCHQCGDTKPMIEKCPSCETVGRMAPIGPGVERLGEEAAKLFPDAMVTVLSSDMYKTARALKEKIEEIASGGADIIIGTQLIAKGHNFPNLTLVGVIDADLGLQGSDLRAAERTFQLMRQVAGRAGRAKKTGSALIQTYQPEHPVIRAILAGEEEEFWRAEAFEREQAGVPPYGRMAGIILSGSNVTQVFEAANMLAKNIFALTRIDAKVFGPAPAPVARIRGRHRVRLLVKAGKGVALQSALVEWVSQVRLKGDARLSIDIDPQSFY